MKKDNRKKKQATGVAISLIRPRFEDGQVRNLKLRLRQMARKMGCTEAKVIRDALELFFAQKSVDSVPIETYNGDAT